MARFYGKVGFAVEQYEDPPGSGIWKRDAAEVSYFGDVIRKAMNVDDTTGNGDLMSGNRISILADEYANTHYSKIRYVEWEGVRWTVNSVEVQRPRLILALGEVFNG